MEYNSTEELLVDFVRYVNDLDYEDAIKDL